MGFKKGDPRPANAGRKPGSPNKKSMLVKEVLESHGINLVDQILVRLPTLDKDKQVAALTQLLPYVYPKLTNIEHSGSIGPYDDMTLEQLNELLAEKLKKKK